MAYQALARKWRPRNFSEVVGQDHVVRALTHALEFERLHHAYLFTGTRGVGKTTLARILAKAMNCEARAGFNPCGNCLICREVDEGRFVDLIEVDAASRTKVEDTRDLLENVQYAPNQGRFKVYLIDEVHMLSGHSFNALLKTLEEPPPHVKFLLATTDPQKIPVTVLSRCLQFNLKRLSAEQIRGQMESILTQEGIGFEQNALRALARAADGSMRDGLSLLDQAIAHGGGKLEDGLVSAMLGTVSRKPVFGLLDALAENDAAILLQTISDMAEHSPNFSDVLQQLLIVLHHASLAQWVPDAVRHDDDAERILDLAKRLSPEDLQLYYQIGLLGQRDLPLAPEPRCGFEMTMLRMLAFRPSGHEDSGAKSAPTEKTAIARNSPETSTTEPQSLGHVSSAAVGEEDRLAAVREKLGMGSSARRPPPSPAVDTAESRASSVRPEVSKGQHDRLDSRVFSPAVPEIAESSPGQISTGFQPEPAGAAPSAVEETSQSAPSIDEEARQVTADWPAIIKQMKLSGLTLQLANHCLLQEMDKDRVHLAMDPEAKALRTPQIEAKLESALQDHFGRPLKLTIGDETPARETPASQMRRQREERQQAAEREIAQDPFVVSLKERLDARIVPGSIKPLE